MAVLQKHEFKEENNKSRIDFCIEFRGMYLTVIHEIQTHLGIGLNIPMPKNGTEPSTYINIVFLIKLDQTKNPESSNLNLSGQNFLRI